MSPLSIIHTMPNFGDGVIMMTMQVLDFPLFVNDGGTSLESDLGVGPLPAQGQKKRCKCMDASSLTYPCDVSL